MNSTTIFIPAENSAFANEPAGNPIHTLNMMALMRVMNPQRLMPTTSSLEKMIPDGQFLGLQAGANTVTIHDGTPEDLQQYINQSTPRWEEFKRFQELGLIPVHGDFSPAGVHYPPITNYLPITQEEAYRDYKETNPSEFDVYVHIPFCHKRCLFCHYPSHYNCGDSEKDTYLAALEKEMQNWLAFLQPTCRQSN